LWLHLFTVDPVILAAGLSYLPERADYQLLKLRGDHLGQGAIWTCLLPAASHALVESHKTDMKDL
jgi:hypothetical protein